MKKKEPLQKVGRKKNGEVKRLRGSLTSSKFFFPSYLGTFCLTAFSRCFLMLFVEIPAGWEENQRPRAARAIFFPKPSSHGLPKKKRRTQGLQEGVGSLETNHHLESPGTRGPALKFFKSKGDSNPVAPKDRHTAGYLGYLRRR